MPVSADRNIWLSAANGSGPTAELTLHPRGWEASIMKKTLATLLCVVVPAAVFAADIGHKVDYDGGSLTEVKAGTQLKLLIDSERIQLMKDKKEVLTLPPASVMELSYGQDVHRRIGAAIGIAVFTLGIGALMALTKSKKHYVGLTWNDAGKKGGIAFQADKSDYRGILAGLEGVTGKKAVNTETLSVKN